MTIEAAKITFYIPKESHPHLASMSQYAMILVTRIQREHSMDVLRNPDTAAIKKLIIVPHLATAARITGLVANDNALSYGFMGGLDYVVLQSRDLMSFKSAGPDNGSKLMLGFAHELDRDTLAASRNEILRREFNGGHVLGDYPVIRKQLLADFSEQDAGALPPASKIESAVAYRYEDGQPFGVQSSIAIFEAPFAQLVGVAPNYLNPEDKGVHTALMTYINPAQRRVAMPA